MSTGISMRQLHKMSAADIQALPHPTPIKSGDRTIGIIRPVHDIARPVRNDKAALTAALKLIDEAAAKRTPEENAAIDRFLAERGID